MKSIPAPVTIAVLGNDRLHRAVVALPDAMGERDRGYQERIVFFEAHRVLPTPRRTSSDCSLPPGAPTPATGASVASSTTCGHSAS